MFSKNILILFPLSMKWNIYLKNYAVLHVKKKLWVDWQNHDYSHSSKLRKYCIKKNKICKIKKKSLPFNTLERRPNSYNIFYNSHDLKNKKIKKLF